MSPGHDDEILPADFIDRRIGLTAGWQKILPKRRPAIAIDVADKIARRRADEDDPGCGDHGAAIIRRAVRRVSNRATHAVRRVESLPIGAISRTYRRGFRQRRAT